MAHIRMALVAAVIMGCISPEASAASAFAERSDGALQMDGRTLRCGNARSTLDDSLPNLGMSMPDARLLIFNPTLLGRHTGVVRLFVFHHECGHQHVGASELGADCWAVRRGVSDGWLNRKGLAQVCKSFGNGRGSDTHPAATARCANLDQCFSVAAAELARRQKRDAAVHSSLRAPQLVSGPRLIRSGVLR